MNHRFGTGVELGSKPLPCSESEYSGYSSLRRCGTTSRTPRRGSSSERGNGSSPYVGSCGRIGGKSSGGSSASTTALCAPGSGLNCEGGSSGGGCVSTTGVSSSTMSILASANSCSEKPTSI